MNASHILVSRKLALLAGGFLLLLGMVLGLGLRALLPSQTSTPFPIPSSTPFPAAAVLATNTLAPRPAAATGRPAKPTPTTTPDLPEPTPPDSPLPAEFLARLNLGVIETFALSPQADRLAAAGASHICLLATGDYERIWCSLTIPQVEMESPENAGTYKRVRGLAFRNDGAQIAVALWNGYIAILDAAQGERVNLIETQRAYIHDLNWSADGKQIMAVSNQGGIEVWDASSGEFVRQLELDPASLSRAAWSADGSVFATADWEGIITFWDAASDEPTGALQVQLTGYISSLAWSPDNSTIYAGIATDYPCTEDCDPDDPEYKGWVAAWDVASGKLLFRSSVGDAITSLAVSPDREWVAAGGGIFGAFAVLDGSTGNMHAKLLDTYAQDGVAWLDEGRALYLPNPKHVDAMSITEWDMTWAEHTEILLPGYETISSMAWLPGGERLVTNSAGGTISTWQASTGQRLEQFQLFVGDLPLSKFSPAWISPVEPWLAAGADGSLAIVDLEKRQVRQWLEHADIAPQIYIVELAWSRDGRMLAGLVGDAAHARRLTAAVWDIRTGERLLTVLEEDLLAINTLSWSPDGERLALSLTSRGSEMVETLAVRELASGEEVQSLDIPCQASQIDWFASEQIAFVCYARTHIWDLQQGAVWESPGPAGYPEISPGGNMAATGSAMEGIRLWDFPTGEELALLGAQSDWFSRFAFSPDGAQLASLSDHGSLVLWDVSAYLEP